ncbi:hypothetical protein [Nannocystis punicea]|uniref:Uncharacterized protein n=1 Tax=Nannocystis punicea TaxID=2995304 RepID=A0ABY7H617_9BACT|nr:hypothetical protein [Nannocystis poenicansa]WAS94721.1 hypothetical protein O0S08_01055 [Nannocystis poenicansa]
MIALALLLVVQAPTGASSGPVPATEPSAPVAADPPPVAEEGLAEPVAPLSPVAADPAPVGEARPTEPAAPLATTVVAERPAPARGKFVFAWLPSVFTGIGFPSTAPVTLFFGGRLPRTWALGYQLTVSFGLAERYLSGLLAHRHHLTALHGFGANRRGFTSVGAGVAFNMPLLPVVEVEGRIGVRLGDERRWVIGALARLGWDIGHQERAPMPQFGAFVGWTML